MVMHMPGDVAVVIPYFQRTPGVLARTLAAAFAQEGFGTPDRHRR
jgi:hypothetical protein